MALQTPLIMARMGPYCSRNNWPPCSDIRVHSGNARPARREQPYGHLASLSSFSASLQQLRIANGRNKKRHCIVRAGLGDLRQQTVPSNMGRKNLHLSSGGQRDTQVAPLAAHNGAQQSAGLDDIMPLNAMLDIKRLDKIKWESMQYRRSAFTAQEWEAHRSTGRHKRHITSILRSRVILALGPVVLRITAISAALVGWNTLVQSGTLPPGTPLLHINPLPVTLTSSALSFLLVFRTNASYGRFDEARKMWGLLLNRTRDICRQALTYVNQEHDVAVREQMLRHVRAFPLVLKHHLLQEGTLEQELKALSDLTTNEIAGVLSATHKPNYVLHMISECLGTSTVDPQQRFSMDQNLTSFADDVGGCERIFKTPIPLSYTRLTSRGLVIWNTFLPLALWDSMGAYTIPTTFFIAASLFCVEEVGVLIEEPFSLLALDNIAASARANGQEMIKNHESVRQLVRTGGMVKLEGEPHEEARAGVPVSALTAK